jgi:hypothetical protein
MKSSILQSTTRYGLSDNFSYLSNISKKSYFICKTLSSLLKSYCYYTIKIYRDSSQFSSVGFLYFLCRTMTTADRTIPVDNFYIFYNCKLQNEWNLTMISLNSSTIKQMWVYIHCTRKKVSTRLKMVYAVTKYTEFTKAFFTLTMSYTFTAHTHTHTHVTSFMLTRKVKPSLNQALHDS